MISSALTAVFQIASQGLFARRINLLLGGLVMVAAVLLMVGVAVLGTIGKSISSAMQGCCFGHVTVWSKAASPKVGATLNLFPSDEVFPVLGPIPKVEEVEKSLQAVPGVRVVIPLGMGAVQYYDPNLMDRLLDRARALNGAGEGEAQARAEVKAHLRFLAEELKRSLERNRELTDAAYFASNMAELEKVTSDAFWQGFDAKPLEAIEHLANQVAPQLDAAGQTDVAFIAAGTDVPEYLSKLPKMKVIEGTPVPPGQRGLIFNKIVYEEQLKHVVAQRLDRLTETVELGGAIADDPDLQELVEQNVAMISRLVLELGPTRGPQVAQALAAALQKPAATPLPELLEALLRTDDANLHARVKLFYEVVGPHIPLYRIKLGDTVVLKMDGPDGYTRTTKVKVYGTMVFTGLEKSYFGDLTVMDMVTFRELYGQDTPDLAEEVAALSKKANIQDSTREQLEKELFAPAQVAELSEIEEPDLDHLPTIAAVGETFDPATERIRGALYLAVHLDDEARIPEAMAAMGPTAAQHGLGVEPWKDAAGTLAVFPQTLVIVLYTVAGLIFIVVSLVLGHSVMSTTVQRTQEFGTMRALGAQRGFLIAVVLSETLAVTLAGGGLGIALSAVLIELLHTNGIPTGGNYLLFTLFGGPRLYPTLSPVHAAFGLAALTGITAVAAVAPSLFAVKVSPIRAMQAEE